MRLPRIRVTVPLWLPRIRGSELRLSEYRPRPRAVLAETAVKRSAVPAIEAHKHLGRWLTSWVAPDREWMVDDVHALVDVMDRCRVEAIVNLDGRTLADLEQNLDRHDRAHPRPFHPLSPPTRGTRGAPGAGAGGTPRCSPA